MGLLRLYYFLAFGAFGLYLPFFPTWLNNQGFVGAQMSALVATMPIMSLVSPPLVGMIADRWRLRGRMMTLTSGLTALGVTAFGLASALSRSLPFSTALLCMLVFAAFRGPMVGLADVLALEGRRNYGRLRLFGSAGFLLTATLGGQVLDLRHPFALPLSVAAALWLCTGMSLLLPKTTTLPPRPAVLDAKALLTQSGFRWLMAAVCLAFLSHSAYDLCASLRLRDLGAGPGYVGIFWASGTFAEIILMFFAAPFIERFGPGKLLTLAALCAALRWLFLSQADDLVTILCLQPLHAVTFGLMWLSCIATVRREVAERGMATGQGLFSAATAVGTALGLGFWGIAYDALGSEWVFRAAAVVAVACALSASRLIRRSLPS